jgi:ATP-dependent helicase/nuclease subunit A
MEAESETWEEQEAAPVQEYQWEEPPKPSFLSGETTMNGAMKGTLYHLALEHLPYERLNQDSSPDEIEGWLDELRDAGYLQAQERNVLRAGRFQTFLRSSLGQRMGQASRRGELHREQQFMMGKPAGTLYRECDSQETVLVQGIIDAWFLEGEDIVLVDYKTDSVTEDAGELVEKYKMQLDYYREALERMTGRKVREEIIYSLSLGESTTIS